MLITKLTVNIRKSVNVHKDQRINHLSEMIAGMKEIKMYGWQNYFQGMIQEERKK